jgi:hypothetical protein
MKTRKKRSLKIRLQFVQRKSAQVANRQAHVAGNVLTRWWLVITEYEKGQRLRSWRKLASFLPCSKCGSSPSILSVCVWFLFCGRQLEANRCHLTRRSSQYQTPEGSTKTLLTHLPRDHLTDDEDHSPNVRLEDAQGLFSTTFTAEVAPNDVYEDFITIKQGRHQEFGNTRFRFKRVCWLEIGQLLFLEAESEALQSVFEDCCLEVKLKSLTTYHRLLLEVHNLECPKLKDLFRQHAGVINFTYVYWSDSEQEESQCEFGTPGVTDIRANSQGITIDWIDSDFCQRSDVLELEPIVGERTGRKLPEGSDKTLAKLGVGPRINLITTHGGSDMLLVVRIRNNCFPALPLRTTDFAFLHILSNAA